MMRDLCTSTCRDSLDTLLANVKNGCGSASIPFNEGVLTWTEQIEYFQYKFGLVCLRDESKLGILRGP